MREQSSSPVGVYDAAGKITYADGKAVFTVETSVRTAMMAVYKTMHLDRPSTPLKINQELEKLVDAINSIPPVPKYYAEREENK